MQRVTWFRIERLWRDGEWRTVESGRTELRSAVRAAVRLARDINRRREGAYRRAGTVRLLLGNDDGDDVALTVEARREGGLVLTRTDDGVSEAIADLVAWEYGWKEVQPAVWRWIPASR